MGRHANFRGGPGPRSHLVPDRELERALRGDVEPSFGIRRPLTEASAKAVGDVIFGLQETGDIPPYPDVTLRDRLGVTILSKRTLGRQILRGMAKGYSLGRVQAQFSRHGAWEESGDDLPIAVKGIAVYQNRVIYAELDDDPLADEIQVVEDILVRSGVRGLSRDRRSKKPRLVLGSAERSRPISITEQRHVIHKLEEAISPVVNVEDWESYPDNIFA